MREIRFLSALPSKPRERGLRVLKREKATEVWEGLEEGEKILKRSSKGKILHTFSVNLRLRIWLLNSILIFLLFRGSMRWCKVVILRVSLWFQKWKRRGKSLFDVVKYLKWCYGKNVEIWSYWLCSFIEDYVVTNCCGVVWWKKRKVSK